VRGRATKRCQHFLWLQSQSLPSGSLLRMRIEKWAQEVATASVDHKLLVAMAADLAQRFGSQTKEVLSAMHAWADKQGLTAH
jgi:hypothetical protein